MGNTRKIVSVSLAVALAATLAIYVLVPRTGPNTANVVTNEPQTPTDGPGTTDGGGTQAGGGGTTPTPDARPAKLHGENSHGPKHALPVCLSEKDGVGNGVSQYQGANWYRADCGSSAGAVPSVHTDGEAGSSVVAVTGQLYRSSHGV